MMLSRQRLAAPLHAVFLALSLWSGLAVADARYAIADPVDALHYAVPPAASDEMAMTALTLMGTPYKYGGTSPEQGFDCSGLVQYIYRDISSVVLPRTAAGMAQLAGRDVTTRELTVGDLLFFRLGNSGNINHVAVYIGQDRFVHAPHTGSQVRIDKLDSRYWMRYFDRARRLFSDEGHLEQGRFSQR